MPLGMVSELCQRHGTDKTDLKPSHINFLEGIVENLCLRMMRKIQGIDYIVD